MKIRTYVTVSPVKLWDYIIFIDNTKQSWLLFQPFPAFFNLNYRLCISRHICNIVPFVVIEEYLRYGVTRYYLVSMSATIVSKMKFSGHGNIGINLLCFIRQSPCLHRINVLLRNGEIKVKIIIIGTHYYYYYYLALQLCTEE